MGSRRVFAVAATLVVGLGVASLAVAASQNHGKGNHNGSNRSTQVHNFGNDAGPVSKYGVYEVTLRGDGSVPNPFDTAASVTFVPPSGKANAKTVNAFYDGGNIWKARAYINETGSWTWRSSSFSDRGLGNKAGGFTAVDSNLRGMLRKHNANPKQWMTDNGRTFLNIGDTAYYLFGRTNADGVPISDATFHKYVHDDVGLNVTSLCADMNGGGFLDPLWKNIFSDTGTNTRPNLAAFKTTDRRLTWLLENYPAIYVNMTIIPENSSGVKGGNTQPDNTFWANLSSAQRTRLLKQVLARYAAFPAIFWAITNDTNYGPSFPRNTAMAAEVGSYFQAHDPWNHLLSTGGIRNSVPYFIDAGWNSYRRIETPGAYAADQLVNIYSSYPLHTFVSEDFYEHGGQVKNAQYFYRWMFWSWLTSGGSLAYGSVNWDKLLPYSHAGLEGLDQVKFIAPYFSKRGIDIAQWQDADNLATDIDGTTGDRRPQAMRKGHNGYLVYHPNSVSAGVSPQLKRSAAKIRLDLSGASGTFGNVEWFRAYDATVHAGRKVDGGGTVVFTAPWTGRDVVLYLSH